MAVGDPVELFRLDDELGLGSYYKSHTLKTNKTRSNAYFEAGGEQDAAQITFTLRWHKLLSEIEYSMSDFRLKWHDVLFDIIGYDDYMYQHRKVDIACRSLGEKIVDLDPEYPDEETEEEGEEDAESLYS